MMSILQQQKNALKLDEKKSPKKIKILKISTFRLLLIKFILETI